MLPIIQCQKVCFRYSDEDDWVLQAVDLTIEQGEYLSILGPNGSGKSSLARLLNGLFLPTFGEVWVCGKNTKVCEHQAEIRQNVGMVFQNPDHQIVGATVLDDIVFGLENIGIPRSEMEERIDTVLKQMGLKELEHKEPHRLSGGQKQRLAIASVLAMQPKAIIFDEATSMLDPQGRAELLTIMNQLHRSGLTIIHITHSVEEAFQAERILVMDQGKVLLDMKEKPAFPQMERLKPWDFEMPLAYQLYHELVKRNWPLSQSIEDLEEFVEQLCKWLSKA